MRVTNQMMTNHAIQNMAESLETLQRLSERAANGKRFQSASEDPAAASTSLNLRSVLQAAKSYQFTIDRTNDWMNANEFSLQRAGELALRAENLIQRGLNDTLSAEERQTALATELDGLIQQVVDLANTTHNGQYIFAGYQVKTAPIELTDPNTIPYHGDQGEISQSIDSGQHVEMNLRADAVFQPLLEAMIAARNELNENDLTGLRAAFDTLKTASDGIDQFRTANGARLNQMKDHTSYLEKVELEVKALLTKNEGVNMAEAISLYKSQETVYQSVIEVSQRSISAMNLFDYLR
ncbi:MAG TPA: flagellar hook-associated protein FlgL [Anaerolineaceae bacterium]|nr:flagellar hook-associated protein FlgL [Anaerolineaceae bacterium]